MAFYHHKYLTNVLSLICTRTCHQPWGMYKNSHSLVSKQIIARGPKRTLLDANLALNLMQGQAQSEDGDYEIPTVTYQDEEVPTTSTSKPTGSKTPPSPNLAPPPPPSCPPPFHAIHPYHINCVRYLSPQVISKSENRKQLNNCLRDIPTPPIPPPPPPRQTMMPLVNITTNFNCEDRIPTAQVIRQQKRIASQLARKLKGQYKPKSI
jgi:hypothetical protein